MYSVRKEQRREIIDEFKKSKEGGGSGPKVRQIEPDDLVAPMSIETYVMFRVRPLAARFETEAPHLNRVLQCLEVVTFVANSSGAVLAVITIGTISLSSFVAITVAFASMFSSMIEYHNLQARVSATNAALRDAHNLLTWWGSLSMVDRRTRRSKYHIVSTMERCVLSTVQAMAAVASASGDAGEDPSN